MSVAFTIVNYLSNFNFIVSKNHFTAQYYKRNLLDGFNSTSAAWHFVYKVIKNLYSRASLLSDHALYMCLNNTVDPSYVFKDSASKTEVQTLIRFE